MSAPTARELLESLEDLRRKAAALQVELRAYKGALPAQPLPHQARRLRLLQCEARRGQRQLKARVRLLQNLLPALPRDSRQVLVLRYLSGLSYLEISEALGFSQRHVYRLHLQGVRQLQTTL